MLCMTRKLPKRLDTPAGKHRLLARLEEYVATCRPPPDVDARKTSGRLANLAGFCRFLGCSIAALQAACAGEEELYSLICTTLEDELLTSTPSPSLLSYYLKKRLGYEESSEVASAQCGEMRLVFEHDILEDGA